jgi:hypothetical protein
VVNGYDEDFGLDIPKRQKPYEERQWPFYYYKVDDQGKVILSAKGEKTLSPRCPDISCRKLLVAASEKGSEYYACPDCLCGDMLFYPKCHFPFLLKWNDMVERQIFREGNQEGKFYIPQTCDFHNGNGDMAPIQARVLAIFNGTELCTEIMAKATRCIEWGEGCKWKENGVTDEQIAQRLTFYNALNARISKSEKEKWISSVSKKGLLQKEEREGPSYSKGGPYKKFNSFRPTWMTKHNKILQLSASNAEGYISVGMNKSFASGRKLLNCCVAGCNRFRYLAMVAMNRDLIYGPCGQGSINANSVDVDIKDPDIRRNVLPKRILTKLKMENLVHPKELQASNTISTMMSWFGSEEEEKEGAIEDLKFGSFSDDLGEVPA